jgi:heme/copper-type cytochrome/quinol oxidase subunit 2
MNIDDRSSNLKNLHVFMQVYNILMALMYVCATLCVGFYVLMIGAAAVSPSSSMEEMEGMSMAIFLGMFCVIFLLMVVFMIGYFYLAFTVTKRSMTNFVLQILGLSLGLSSILTMIPAIILLVFWVLDENRHYITTKPEHHRVGGSDNGTAGAVSLSDGLDDLNTKATDKGEVVKLKTADKKEPRQVASPDLDGDK